MHRDGTTTPRALQKTIDEFNGYLYALHRLCDERCDFWAELIAANEEEALANMATTHITQRVTDTEILTEEPVAYPRIQQLLDERLVTKLVGISQGQQRLLVWDIEEYYGLAAQAENAEGEFAPLIASDNLMIEARPSFHELITCLITQLDRHLVITAFASRRPAHQD